MTNHYFLRELVAHNEQSRGPQRFGYPPTQGDLCEEQMGFRPGRDAKAAVRLVYYQMRQKGREEVVMPT
jgi:hypothetical protein